jgi:hypothetical protein
VSDAGHVRNSRTGRVLKPWRASNGYLLVQFGRTSPRRVHLVHRLVASAFVPGAGDTLTVNHKNGQRDDNRAANLEWLTHGDNHRHSYTELQRKPHAWTRPVEVDGQRFASQNEAARYLGVHGASVASALSRGHRIAGKEIKRV